MNYWKNTSLILLCSAFLFCAGCQTARQGVPPEKQTPSSTAQVQEEFKSDPFESYNRAATNFNFWVNRNVYAPVSKAYRWVLPSFARTGINNFLTNLNQPVIMVNSLLQGDVDAGAHAFGRFFTNTTLGIFGLWDVATPLDIGAPKRDFGQTLYVWGIKDGGPHLVIPFMGPSNVRDTVGFGVNFFIDPMDYILPKLDKDHLLLWRYAFWGVDVMDRATDLLTHVEETSVDPYIALKTMYEQNREKHLTGKDPAAREQPSYDFSFDDDDE